MNVSTTSSDDQLEEDYVILADSVVTDALNSISLETSQSSPQAPPPSPPPHPPPPLPLKRREKNRHGADSEQPADPALRHSDHSHHQNHPQHHGDQQRGGRHPHHSHSGGHFVTDTGQDKVKEKQHGKHRRRSSGRRLPASEGETNPGKTDCEHLAVDGSDAVDAPDGSRITSSAVPKSRSSPYIHAEHEKKQHHVSQDDLDPVDRDLYSRPKNIQSHSECCQQTKHDNSRNSPCPAVRKSHAKRAFSDSRIGVKDGSRSPTGFLQSQDKSEEMFCEGLNRRDTIFDPDGHVPATAVIHINNMSEHQMRVFHEGGSEELQGTSRAASATESQNKDREAGCEHNVDTRDDEMDNDNSSSAMSIVTELVGGLDSQIRALCRNLEVLLLSRGSGGCDGPGEGESGSTTQVKACDDSSCLSVLDEPERFYDCFSPDSDSRPECHDSFKSSQDLAAGFPHRPRHDGSSTTSTPSKARQAPLIPAPGVPPEKDSSRRAEDQSREWLEIAGGGGETTYPRQGPPRQPPAPRPPPRPPKSLPPLSQEQPTGQFERGRPVNVKSGSDGECAWASHQKRQCPRQDAAKPGQAQSMLALPPRSKVREAFNVIEVCTESSSSNDSVPDKGPGTPQGSTGDDNDEGGASWGRAVGLEKLVSRELSQVFDQSDVLRTMWNNHKQQLCDLLANREREAARAERLEQALVRARNLVTSLRRQRRDLHRYLEQKEEEWASVLRCHRNEAAFLRRKVLTELEEKKNVLADPKRDGKFAAVLDSLLSLHIDREQFLALDLGKQNKIHELKLLAVRQQLALEELKERNADLNHALSSLLQCLPGSSAAPPHQPRAPCSPHPRATTTSTMSSGCVLGPRGPGLADMLYCDRSVFLPRHPTSPDLAAVTVFSVGGEQSPLSSPVDIEFDASRQRCYADGDNFNHYGEAINTGSNSLAEELLRELTLYGPGNPDFTLADSN